MIANLLSDLSFFGVVRIVTYLLALLLALAIHEFAHAFIADRLGDPTPKLQGRLTLNPKAHLDPLGMLSLLFFSFGWGKPVQIDPYNFRNKRRDEGYVAVAGIVANLLTALLCSGLLHLLNYVGLVNINLVTIVAVFFLTAMLQISVVLAAFNLIPIPPLDGSKILMSLLPPESSRAFFAFAGKFGYIILLLLVLPILSSPSPITHLLIPLTTFITEVLLP
ncbi:site-2 protease family protein [Microgenomates group bacterium]|nr:site-2 protease family protein [Microgenomates group bacterium]